MEWFDFEWLWIGYVKNQRLIMIHGYHCCFLADLVHLFGACLSLPSRFNPSSCHLLFVLQRNNNHKHNNHKNHSCSLFSLKKLHLFTTSPSLWNSFVYVPKNPFRQADVGESTGGFNPGGCGQGDKAGDLL